MGKIKKWMDCNKLSVNVDKTKYMLIRPKEERNTQIYYNGMKLQQVDTYLYLGVYIDDMMCWKHHINQLKTKLSRIAGVFRRLGQIIPKSLRRSVYFSLFHSSIVYGMVVWSSTTNEQIKELQIIQNRAIKNLYQYPKLTSTKTIHSETSILKVEDNITLLLAKQIHATHFNTMHTSTKLQYQHDVHTHNTRNRDNIRCNPVKTTKFGLNSVFNKSCKIYNGLPKETKDLNQHKFTAEIKKIYAINTLINSNFNFHLKSIYFTVSF